MFFPNKGMRAEDRFTCVGFAGVFNDLYRLKIEIPKSSLVGILGI
jgi:hypothetical protein